MGSVTVDEQMQQTDPNFQVVTLRLAVQRMTEKLNLNNPTGAISIKNKYQADNKFR